MEGDRNINPIIVYFMLHNYYESVEADTLRFFVSGTSSLLGAGSESKGRFAFVTAATLVSFAVDEPDFDGAVGLTALFFTITPFNDFFSSFLG